MVETVLVSGNVLVESRSDPEAFGRFFREHAEELLRFFYRATRDTEAAADLTSETFAMVLDRLDRYDPAKGQPVQWLFGIARYQLYGYWRHERVDQAARRILSIPDEPVDHGTADALEAVEGAKDNTSVLSQIDALPGRMSTAVRLRFVEQLSYSEIAVELGTTAGNARVLVHRGLDQLRIATVDE